MNEVVFTTALPLLIKNLPTAFVLSTGRSGTTTLAELLGLSPRTCAFHEPYPQLKDVRLMGYKSGPITPNEDCIKKFVRARLRKLVHARLTGKAYVETSARLTFLAPSLNHYFESCKFIHLHRHPAEVVRSGMRRKWYGGHADDRNRLMPYKADELNRWLCFTPFEKCCWYWNACHEFALECKKGLGEKNVFTLRADDLFKLDSGVHDQVFDFLGLERPHAHKLDSVLIRKDNRQINGEFPHYQDWSRKQRQSLVRLVGTTATELGYILE